MTLAVARLGAEERLAAVPMAETGRVAQQWLQAEVWEQWAEAVRQSAGSASPLAALEAKDPLIGRGVRIVRKIARQGALRNWYKMTPCVLP
jgi:hypothetical protein